MSVEDDRYDRQVRLFGAEGQARLEALQVAIVGMGGLGSHAAQQLAYLGIHRFALIDHDRVSRSNLNRLIGANEDDARERRYKVEIAEQMVQRIQPEAAIKIVREPFITEAGFAALHAADVVVGCMDSDASRLILNEFCQAYELPYLDVATDIEPGTPPSYGGRILYSVGGEMCVYCKDLLDPDAIQEALTTHEQRRDAEQIYGVPHAALGGTGPAVVSLNGILASVAVTELLLDVVGLRPANRHLEYMGSMGRLVVNREPSSPDCYYCKGVRSAREGADVERYVREGWGARIFPCEV